MISETSAGIVLFRREGPKARFLLLQYPTGHWDFVKGKMEPGESARQTAVRETAEETGITDVRFVDGFEEWIEYEFMHAGNRIHKRVVFFLAETAASDVRLSFEHHDFEWRSYGEAMGRVTYENARRVLRAAHGLV